MSQERTAEGNRPRARDAVAGGGAAACGAAVRVSPDRGRRLQPHLPRRGCARRCVHPAPSAGGGCAGHGARHEPRVAHHARARRACAGGAGARDAGLLRRCRGDRRAVLRDGVRRRADPARSRRRGRHGRRGLPHGDALAGGDAGRLPRARSRDSRAGRSREARQATWHGSWRAGGDRWKPRRRATCRCWTSCTSAWAPPSRPRRGVPGSRTAITGSTTPCSGPTTACARCSTGSSAPSAIRWRTSSGR